MPRDIKNWERISDSYIRDVGGVHFQPRFWLKLEKEYEHMEEDGYDMSTVTLTDVKDRIMD